MSIANRYARKVDGPHRACGHVFRALCPFAMDTHAYKRFVDWVIKTARGTVFFVEVKPPARPGRLTDDQREMQRLLGNSFVVVTNEYEAREVCLR